MSDDNSPQKTSPVGLRRRPAWVRGLAYLLCFWLLVLAIVMLMQVLHALRTFF